MHAAEARRPTGMYGVQLFGVHENPPESTYVVQIPSLASTGRLGWTNRVAKTPGGRLADISKSIRRRTNQSVFSKQALISLIGCFEHFGPSVSKTDFAYMMPFGRERPPKSVNHRTI
jgi:hypothetical protein